MDFIRENNRDISYWDIIMDTYGVLDAAICCGF